MIHQPNRRDFLKTTAVTGVGYWVAAGTHRVRAQESPNERISVANIGIGGKGGSDSSNAARFADTYAICDVDKNRLGGAAKKYEGAKTYTDWRKMLEECEKSIDMVTISTPDHSHTPATLMAMKMGKHCYTQKPLTRTIYEARLLGEVARETGVCTQMGNQGSALDSLREAVAQIQAGAIGEIQEVHVWTNRPVWPQGEPPETLETFAAQARKEKPDQADKLIEMKKKQIKKDLENLEWDLWIGPSPYRDYYPGQYHPFAWRGWWDFGSGALGDMACHTVNMPYAACGLANPTSVVAETSGHGFNSFPARSVIHFEFPANESRPAVPFTWYDGGNIPPNLEEMLDGLDPDQKKKYLAKGAGKMSGALIVGSEGKVFSPDDYCGRWSLIGGEKKDVEFRKAPQPEGQNLSYDTRNMYELITAIKENDPSLCYSNFPNHAGPLTETILLGNLAVWTAPNGKGEKVQWDAKNLKVTNKVDTPGVEELIKPTYRDGYSMEA